MYFSALKKAIQNLEEKRFYDIALMYLGQRGYQDLSIVDGTGDGGRDVLCSRGDLRIQLSVQKKWDEKINAEAAKTLKSGRHHLIFVTNRLISQKDEQDFLNTKYKQKGHVELTVADLNKVSTALAGPGVIRRSYEALGMAVPIKLNAELKDVAISTVLLFSKEARELRNSIIEANLRAQLLRGSAISENMLIERVAAVLPGTNIERYTKSALSRLRVNGQVLQDASGLRLSDAELQIMQAAETEFLAARELDLKALVDITGMVREDAEKLLDIALELLVRGRDLDGEGPLEASLKDFIAQNALSRIKNSIFEVLSRSSSARIRQYGATIDKIFSANSFDIYRAMECRTELSVILDSSVAMPVIFGLEFGEATSRYGAAAIALKRVCKAHGIKMVVPRGYLNEMAAHGQKALERLDVFNVLSSEARAPLHASENAYISHYTHIAETVEQGGDDLSLLAFLRHFGISQGKTINSIENRIQTVLERQDISIIESGRFDRSDRDIVKSRKKHHDSILIDHDANVLTMLKNDNQKGFIFATWDNVMIELVEEFGRVYADRPTRVIDFLSMASGSDFECEKSYELMATLLHIDEREVAPLAQMIDRICSVEQAYKFDEFIRTARDRNGEVWVLTPQDVAPFIDKHEDNVSREQGGSYDPGEG